MISVMFFFGIFIRDFHFSSSTVLFFSHFNGTQVNWQLASETIESNESSKYTINQFNAWVEKRNQFLQFYLFMFFYMLISRPFCVLPRRRFTSSAKKIERKKILNAPFHQSKCTSVVQPPSARSRTQHFVHSNENNIDATTTKRLRLIIIANKMKKPLLASEADLRSIRIGCCVAVVHSEFQQINTQKSDTKTL